MYRIPTPIKERVQQLAAAFKQVCEGNSGVTSSHLLKQVQSAIAKATYPQSNLEASTNLISGSEDKSNQSSDEAVERLGAVREVISKWKENTKNTRNWVEANRLLKELEEVLGLPKE